VTETVDTSLGASSAEPHEPKKTYRTPQLCDCGSLQDVTRTNVPFNIAFDGIGVTTYAS
jgi:hypothetical protein